MSDRPKQDEPDEVQELVKQLRVDGDWAEKIGESGPVVSSALSALLRGHSDYDRKSRAEELGAADADAHTRDQRPDSELDVPPEPEK